MTRVTALLSSVDCGSPPYGGCALVWATRHIELAGGTAELRDSVARRVLSRFEPEIVYDPSACATPMPLI